MRKRQAMAQISEDTAKIELLKLGYEVFDPHFHTTPIDILAYKDGKFLKLQVKTLYKRTKSHVKQYTKNSNNYKTPQYQGQLVKIKAQKDYTGKFLKYSYTSEEIDGFILVHEKDNICLYFPISEIKGQTFKRTKQGCQEYDIRKRL